MKFGYKVLFKKGYIDSYWKDPQKVKGALSHEKEPISYYKYSVGIDFLIMGIVGLSLGIMGIISILKSFKG